MRLRAVGLYGSLDVSLDEQHDMNDVLVRVIIPIAMHFGFSHRIVSEQEFWAQHPDAAGAL